MKHSSSLSTLLVLFWGCIFGMYIIVWTYMLHGKGNLYSLELFNIINHSSLSSGIRTEGRQSECWIIVCREGRQTECWILVCREGRQTECWILVCREGRQTECWILVCRVGRQSECWILVCKEGRQSECGILVCKNVILIAINYSTYFMSLHVVFRMRCYRTQ